MTTASAAAVVAAPPVSQTVQTKTLSRQNTATASKTQRKQHLSLTSILAKIQATATAYSTLLTTWSQVPSARTLKHLEHQLDLAIHQGSFDAYAALYDDMVQRYEDPVKRGQNCVAFHVLYIRVLCNYGAFCLTNFETQRAVNLLEESLVVAQRLTTLAQQSSQARNGTLLEDYSTFGDTATIYLRVLLANALSCERLYWRAVQQYQLCRRIMALYPCTAMQQIVPGLTASVPLVPEVVEEDMEQFCHDSRRMRQAIGQGQAQLLLLHSQGSDMTVRLGMQLALARLHRSAGQHKSSQRAYEAYLDRLVSTGREDTEGAMLELGRMLCSETPKLHVGLVYLESAAEVLCEDAETFLRAQPSAADSLEQQHSHGREVKLSAPATRAVVRAASALLDTALAYQKAEEMNKACGAMESVVELLRRGGLTKIAVWAMMQYADMLSTLTFVDRALDFYNEGMKLLILSSEDSITPTMQLGPCQKFLPLRAAEVEAHMAYCLQTYVGDHRRAMQHYNHIFHTCGALWREVTKDSARRRGRRLRSAPASSTVQRTIDFDISPDTVHWVLSNYISCCERVRDWEGAITAQNRLIEMEELVGANLIPSYIKLISLMELAGDLEKQLALYFYLFFLPDELLEPSTRLDVAHGFAKCCYRLGNQRMGAVLLDAVQRVRADNDPVTLIDYAMCLKTLSPQDRVQLNGASDIRTGVTNIVKVFRRAAQVIIAHRVVEAADRAHGDGEESLARTGLANDELMSLIALSRGAFFFHQNGFAEEAADLYATALAMADQASSVASEAYSRELGILLANYATLKAADSPEEAESMYERASRACPAYMEVADVVAEYYIQVGNYVKGAAHMRRVIACNPDNALDMHARLARLGCGDAWDSLSSADRVEVVEHMILGLGVAANRLPTHQVPSTLEDLEVCVRTLEPFLLDGVATTTNDEYACLACYLLQTKFNRPKFLNTMYTEALRRFPYHTAILVNYAKFCADMGFHVLTRKYYAKAYSLADCDFCRTQCYSNYLSSHYTNSQAGTGELLYRYFLQRHPQSTHANLYYANYLGVMLPSPSKTEKYFEEALKLDPQCKQMGLYAHFVWACADNLAFYRSSDVRSLIFDKAEALFRKAVDLEPENPAVLQQLGNFYANRKNRFKQTVLVLHKAHKMSPNNVDIVHQLATSLIEECTRVQQDELKRIGCAARQGVTPAQMSPRLRSLVESSCATLDKALELNPKHRMTLEQYAQFAVVVLKDPALASEMWRRIHQLDHERS